MNIYDKFEEAGHDLVLVAGLQRGISTYYCDRCGALIMLKDQGVHLFHVTHANGTSREDQCYPGRDRDVRDGDGEDEGLRAKLKKLDDEETERFRQSMDDLD